MTWKRRLRWIVPGILLLPLLAVFYVRTHPLVFMKTHTHCITVADLQLHQYAAEHEGRFPSDSKGYGNALLLLDPECYSSLTGPGYDPASFHQAKSTGSDLPEEACGRVYVQGLTSKSNPEIALLFDKLPTPGGDHCPFPRRLCASLGREVLFIRLGQSFVRESDWPEFAKKQVELLIQVGIEPHEAKRLYASKSN